MKTFKEELPRPEQKFEIVFSPGAIRKCEKVGCPNSIFTFVDDNGYHIVHIRCTVCRLSQTAYQDFKYRVIN